MKCPGCGREALSLGDLEFRVEENAVITDGRVIQLTRGESEILQALFEAGPGFPCSRMDLASAIWGVPGYSSNSNSIDVMIGRLRRKLENSEVDIVTVRYKGFALRRSSVSPRQVEEII